MAKEDKKENYTNSLESMRTMIRLAVRQGADESMVRREAERALNESRREAHG